MLDRPLVAWSIVLVVLAAALAGCGSVRTTPPATSSSNRVLLRGLDMPDAYAAGGQLYVVQRVMPPVNEWRNELMRVDPASGRVYATRQLDSTFDQALLARGVLWVTTWWPISPRVSRSWLWRLDPETLAVRSRQLLPALNASGEMAIAGSWLWVGSDELDRVSLSSGRITRRFEIPGGQPVRVASSPSGQTLLVSEGGEIAHVQRRNPRTGAMIASSGPFEGVTTPYIGGVIDGGAWVNESGGMMGYVTRLSVSTLKLTNFMGAQLPPSQFAPPEIWGTNGISARLIDGILWVTQPGGGAQRNYCGDPRSGISWAPIKLPRWGLFLTADANWIYYVPNANMRRAELDREPLDRRCAARTP